MLARVCLSDLHLGDARGVLSSPEIASQTVSYLADLSGGAIGALILNGDIWEECVPADMKTLKNGLAASVLSASQGFLAELLRQVHVDTVVIVPGNHDLSLWSWYCHAAANDFLCTDPKGRLEDAGKWPWSELLGGFGGELRFAYPVFQDVGVGDDFPMLVFTHGHLLDPLVLGWDPTAEYAALEALGCKRPSVPVDGDDLKSVADLALKANEFVLSLWKRYSPRDFTYSNYVMRRLLHPQSCYWQEGMLKDGIFETVNEGLDEPPAHQGNMEQVPWFLGLLLMDPSLPSPVGTIGEGPVGPAFTKPSCLVFGHDHLGLDRMIVACGVPFKVVDSGGWTSEFNGHLPHCHVLVWHKKEDVVPQPYFVRARTKSGGLL
jgi:3',5'-cyclic AMP phosphodiesterase CpdA